jgi:long-chain acyl-CoA synthetase
MLIESLLNSVENYPDRLAVADLLGMEMTFSRLARQATVVRRIVEKESKSPNVGIFLPSSVGFAVAYYGILWAGRVAVPLNLLLHSNELARIVEDAGLDLVITVRFPDDVAHFNSTVDGLPVAKKIYLNEIQLSREVLASYLLRQSRPPRAEPHDVATILYTSGTSGDPKGVMLTHNNLIQNARACIEHLKVEPDHRFMGLLPLFHSFGLTTMMVLPVYLGATVFYMPRFLPAHIGRIVAQQRSTMMYAIASMFWAILHTKTARPEEFQTVKMAIAGGEALPQALYDAWLERFGFPILEGYGLTETSPVVSVNQPWSNRAGTAGKLLPGVEGRAIDDNDRPVAPGTVGELAFRGHCIMKGYYKKPRETAEVIDEDGWFKTGDMGWVDQEGYVAITGRKKEMIIVSGENIYASEIEGVLNKHPAVSESAVIAEKVGGSRGEAPVGFVLLKQGQTTNDADLREFCRQYLPQYKVPKVVWIADQLPRGPTGKVLKRALDPAGPAKARNC